MKQNVKTKVTKKSAAHFLCVAIFDNGSYLYYQSLCETLEGAKIDFRLWLHNHCTRNVVDVQFDAI